MVKRYSFPSIFLHWFMLCLLVAVYSTMELRGIFPKGSASYNDMKTWHYMLGLTVFILVWIRLIAHFVGKTPEVIPTPVVWQVKTSKVVFGAFYVLMIGMPLVGWLILSFGGKIIPYFGFELPALAGPNENMKDTAKEIHEIAATVGYFLVGIHASAALFHHCIVKDNTVKRMWRG
ncbi:MAG: cytochrome b [Sneathiella sp.]